MFHKIQLELLRSTDDDRDLSTTLLPVITEDSKILRHIPLFPGDRVKIEMEVSVEDFQCLYVISTPYKPFDINIDDSELHSDD